MLAVEHSKHSMPYCITTYTSVCIVPNHYAETSSDWTAEAAASRRETVASKPGQWAPLYVYATCIKVHVWLCCLNFASIYI